MLRVQLFQKQLWSFLLHVCFINIHALLRLSTLRPFGPGLFGYLPLGSIHLHFQPNQLLHILIGSKSVYAVMHNLSFPS